HPLLDATLLRGRGPAGAAGAHDPRGHPGSDRMRVTRVQVDLPLAAGAVVALPADAAAYLARVLRLRSGGAFVLFTGDGNDYEARRLAIGKRGAEAEVVGGRAVDNESPLRIVLLQGIARGEKMDLVL